MTTTNEKKLKELAKYLEISENDIQIENEDSNDKYNRYLTEFGSYYVMDDDESWQAVYDDIESLIDDIGLDAFTPYFQDIIVNDFIDDDYFDTYCLDDYRDYCADIENESDDEYGNRLIRESIENGVIDASEVVDGKYTGLKDLQEDLACAIHEKIGEEYDNYVDWYRFNFGNEGLLALLKYRNYSDLDLNRIVDFCIDTDGYGHSIASYDGNTIELENFYAYLFDNKDERN